MLMAGEQMLNNLDGRFAKHLIDGADDYPLEVDLGDEEFAQSVSGEIERLGYRVEVDPITPWVVTIHRT